MPVPNVLMSREEAARQGLTTYFTGLPCKHGHVAKRWVCNTGCLDCANKYVSLRAKSPISHDLVPYGSVTFWRSKRLDPLQLAALNKYVQECINTFCTHVLPSLCKTCDGTHYVPTGDGTNNWKLCPDCPDETRATP